MHKNPNRRTCKACGDWQTRDAQFGAGLAELVALLRRFALGMSSGRGDYPGALTCLVKAIRMLNAFTQVMGVEVQMIWDTVGLFEEAYKGLETGAGFPAPVLCEQGVQTVAVATVDAAVGDFPVEPASASGGPRGTPTKGKGTQTETSVSVDVAVGGPSPGGADIGVSASRAPGWPPPLWRRKHKPIRAHMSPDAPVLTGAEIEPDFGTAQVTKGTQTETTVSVDAAVGGFPWGTADVGDQASRVPGEHPKKSRRKRRRRRNSARTSVPVSPSTNSAMQTGGGDMAAAGQLQVGGREQRNNRGVRATAPPRPAASGPSFAAVAASAGRFRPPTSSAAAGGVRGGEDRVGAPADGGVLRGSLSSSPPPPRPEPKRKKGGPPPFVAAANGNKGMRKPGSSIATKDPWVGGRDVTADIISAVSLLAQCAAGVLALGYPAAPVEASPPSVTSPNVSGSTDGGLAGRDDKGEGGAWAENSPRASRRSPLVEGRLSARGSSRRDRPGVPPR